MGNAESSGRRGGKPPQVRWVVGTLVHAAGVPSCGAGWAPYVVSYSAYSDTGPEDAFLIVSGWM